MNEEAGQSGGPLIFASPLLLHLLDTSNETTKGLYMSDWRATAVPIVNNGAQPMGQLLAYHAAKDPARAALIYADSKTTFGELDARANRRARALAMSGVGQGDFVTLALRNSPEFYETSFALWKLGAVPNPVSDRLAAGERDAIIRLVQPKLLIGIDGALAHGAPTIPAGAPIDESLSSEPLETRISPHWKAMTSGGSTGSPKVIVDAMPSVWDPRQTSFGQRPGMTLLNPGPLYHNAPFALMHLGLFVGSTIVEAGKFDAERTLALIASHHVHWVTLVPTMMQRIWRLGDDIRAKYSLSRLEAVVHMAAACPIWLKEAWIEWLGPDRILEVYAGTERQGATSITGAEWLKHKGSVGRPQPGAQIRIFDEAGQPCTAGQVGQIYFLPDTGPGSTYRYIGAQPERLGEWETLGDLGWLDEEGYLYLADRRKDLIISGGANIYPAEVEAALDRHPDVLSSAVIGLPDPEWGQRVHAFVQPREGVSLDTQELLEFVSRFISRYKLPKAVDIVDYPLRDDAGKVRRSTLWDSISSR